MRTLLEIAREVMAERKARLAEAVGSLDDMKMSEIVSPDWLAKFLAEGAKRQEKTKLRLENDPALKEVLDGALATMMTIIAMAMPPQHKRDGLLQLLVEIVDVWEEVNNRFSEQLKPKE